jgi:hypothetical protein
MNAVDFAQVEIKKQCEAQIAFAQECGIVRDEFVNPYDTTELKHNSRTEFIIHDAITTLTEHTDKANLMKLKLLEKKKSNLY